MVSPEVAKTSGDINSPVDGELISSETSLSTKGVVVEFPRLDPMKLTREQWLNIPSGNLKKEMLVTLRKKEYNPEYVNQVEELFPEGYSLPLSKVENKVFGIMSKIVSSDVDVDLQDKAILEEHLYDVSVDNAITQLKELRRTKAEGGFWYSKDSIGGYGLNRLIAYEIDEQVRNEIYRDSIKLHALTDISAKLEEKGIPMLEADQVELEKLSEEHNERKMAEESYWQSQREEGYRNLGLKSN